MTSAILLTVSMLGCGQTTGPEDALAAKQNTVRILPQSVTLEPGEKTQFSGTIVNRHGKSVGGGEIFWEATGGLITGAGLYTAGQNSGNYRVRARSSNDVVGQASITIVDPDESAPSPVAGQVPTAVEVQPSLVQVQPGETAKFTAVVFDQNGQKMSATVNWTATGGSISNGTFTAGSQTGYYAVTARTSGLSASARVSISSASPSPPSRGGGNGGSKEPPAEDPPVSTTIQVAPGKVELQTGGKQVFTATVRDQFGVPMSKTISWAATGGTITSGGAYSAGTQAGTYSVTATTDGLSASARVTIVAPVPPPSSTPPPSDPPDGAVAVKPGESIQQAVNGNPAGTAFLIKTGIHRRQSVRPKDGTTFIGEAGAVLDGEKAVAYAFEGGSGSSGVTIRNLEIRNYDSPLQMGAIRAGGPDPSDGSTGWVVEGCNIHDNSAGGIRLGHLMVVRNNKIVRNGQIGIVGIGNGVLVEDNEIAFNNTRGIDSGWEAGGTKFVKTRDLVLRGNYVHDNNGPGLWMDGSNINSLVEDNRVEDNKGAAGIFFEISYGAVIRNNEVEGNGNPGSWLYGSEILVSASSDVEVYGNTVVAKYDGITAVMQSRGSGVLGRHEVKNLYVHDNVITMEEGLTGLGQDVGDTSYFTSKNNRFDRNTYYLGTRERHFEWMNGQRTEDQWQDYGLDVNGTFNR